MSNSSAALFGRLKQLFSTGVVVRRSGGKTLKVSDFDAIQAFGSLQSVSQADRYTRLHTNAAFTQTGNNYGIQISRSQLYIDYEAMDTDALCAKALDLLSEEATQRSEIGEVLSVRSSNENVQEELYNLFYNVLNIEFNLPMWIRTACKYGDNFLRLFIAQDLGVYGIQPLSVYEMLREEGLDPNNGLYVRFISDPSAVVGGTNSAVNTKGRKVYENYEIAHFRLLKDTNFLPFGRCLTKNSYVETEYGVKAIDLVEEGDNVWTYNIDKDKYELSSVVKKVCSGVKDIIRVSTKNNFIEGSPNHPMLVYSDGELKYKKIEDLSVKDLLALSDYSYKKMNTGTLINKVTVNKKEGIDNVILDPICKIERLGEDTTYDIQVESDNHNFIANGMIVHNSWYEPARKLYKSYVLLEDAAILHRVMRAPEKRVFYYNVGNIPANEVDAFMQKQLNQVKKTPLTDPATGQYDLKYNVMTMLEDFHIPVRNNDTTTRVETVKGLDYTGMDDIYYFQNKILAALGVPKAFLNYSDELNGKSTLSGLSMVFSKSIEYLQRVFLKELEKIAQVHLYILGYDESDLSNFKLTLTTPSILAEQEKIALLKEKFSLAADIMDKNILSTDWILDNILQMSEDQINQQRDLIVEDVKRKFRHKQIEEEGNDPVMSGVSYGTPHDLASIYKNNASRGDQDLPDGYDEKKKIGDVGRPIVYTSTYGTDKSSVGRDPLGKVDTHDMGKNDRMRPNPRVTMESTFSGIDKYKPKKVQLFEQQEAEMTLLDDRNILDLK